jgi:hypothetical protein
MIIECLLWMRDDPMSPIGPKLTSRCVSPMSAFRGKSGHAPITLQCRLLPRSGPCADFEDGHSIDAQQHLGCEGARNGDVPW